MATTRRNLLRGLSLGAGSCLINPFVEQVRAQAEGKADQVPTRFVFVVKSSGIVPSGITPPKFDQKGPCNESLLDAELPPSMSPLEPFKNQLSMVQGLSGKMCRGGHSSWFGAMGVYMTGGEHKDRKSVV